MKFRKIGEVYLELINVNLCCAFRDGLFISYIVVLNKFIIIVV